MINSYEELSALLQKITDNEPIEPSAIPNIDLYMDQVTSFMEEHLSSYKRDDNDKIMTKTMINNYTKDKVLPPPIKKKYSKDHTMLIILIYHLKQLLSIGDIMKLFNAIPFSDTEKIYKIFIQAQKIEQANMEAVLLEKLKKAEAQPYILENKNMELLLLVLSLAADANLKRQLAISLIDKYFSSTTIIEGRK